MAGFVGSEGCVVGAGGDGGQNTSYLFCGTSLMDDMAALALIIGLALGGGILFYSELFDNVLRYYRRQRRRIDLEILWPALLKRALSLNDARVAFFYHIVNDPAWIKDFSYVQLAEYIDTLTFKKPQTIEKTQNEKILYRQGR